MGNRDMEYNVKAGNCQCEIEMVLYFFHDYEADVTSHFDFHNFI